MENAFTHIFLTFFWICKTIFDPQCYQSVTSFSTDLQQGDLFWPHLQNLFQNRAAKNTLPVI